MKKPISYAAFLLFAALVVPVMVVGAVAAVVVDLATMWVDVVDGVAARFFKGLGV